LNGLWGRAEVARRQGDLATARSSFTEAVSLAWQIGGHCRPALIGLARVSLAAGDPWGGEALLDQTVAEGIPDDAHAQALHEKGALARARGELGKAAALHQEALSAWAAVRDPIGIAQSLEQLAGIAAAEGRPAHAACLFGAAHAARDGTHFPYPPSRDGAQYTKDVALARDRLASEDFDKAWDDGVRLSTDEAIRFASFGSPAQDRPCAGWASLTRAERAVAALVAESLTNREIGERLFISPRTVQTHLSHVFSKLGFSSRRDLARLVARRRAHTTSP
jgi:DNA-binding CsgD family transcriptional regulator